MALTNEHSYRKPAGSDDILDVDGRGREQKKKIPLTFLSWAIGRWWFCSERKETGEEELVLVRRQEGELRFRQVGLKVTKEGLEQVNRLQIIALEGCKHEAWTKRDKDWGELEPQEYEYLKGVQRKTSQQRRLKYWTANCRLWTRHLPRRRVKYWNLQRGEG